MLITSGVEQERKIARKEKCQKYKIIKMNPGVSHMPNKSVGNKVLKRK